MPRPLLAGRPELCDGATAALLLGVGSLLAGWGSALSAALRYDRQSLQEGGEWWRLLSGHLVHGSFTHWSLNLLGFCLILGLFARRDTLRELLLTLALLALAVSAGLYLLNTELLRYVGLSGVLHGLFARYATHDLLAGSRIALVVCAVLAVKLGYEQLFGPAAQTEALVGLPIVVDAHLYGAMAGVLLGLWPRKTTARKAV